MSQTFVVIGASAASISFIAKLRSFDTDSEIICFSGEVHNPYNRCFLVDFLTGQKTKQEIMLKPESWYEEHNVQLYKDTFVTQINTQEKYVIADEQEYAYDYLFIGCGSGPVKLPLAGINDVMNVFLFHTLQDMKEIQAFVDPDEKMHAVVLGGGINGIEAASGLQELGCKVTIIEKQDRLFAHGLEQDCSTFIEKKAESLGIKVLKDAYVTKLILDETETLVQSVLLSNKKTVKVDFVVSAVGAKINNSLCVEAGLHILQGSVLINENMQTSAPNVYAGGDVCMAPDMITGKKVRSASWPDAMLQGLTAASQFSEKPRVYPGVINSRDSYFFGMDFYACGNTTGEHIDTIQEEKGKDFLHKFYIKDSKLAGFVLIGNIEKLGMYKQMYITQKEFVL